MRGLTFFVFLFFFRKFHHSIVDYTLTLVHAKRTKIVKQRERETHKRERESIKNIIIIIIIVTIISITTTLLKKNVSSNGVDRRHRSLPHITNRQIEHDFVVNESHMHDRCEIANGGGVIETLRSWDVRRAI